MSFTSVGTLCRLQPSTSFFNDQSIPWCYGKKFERFWNIYSSCMMYAHKDVLTQCSETKNKLAATLYKLVNSPWPDNFSDFHSKTVKKNKKRRKHRKRKKRLEKKAVPSRPASNMFILTDDDTLYARLEEQMQIDDPREVDDEFLAFMKTSVIHRIKWNQIKKTKQQEENNGQSHILELEEHPDVVRGRELQQLYGDSVGEIQAMETAMQLSFDRISTLHQPAIWPNIPLNLTF